ncbi:MAG: hypothetical protein CVV04_00245 [Firmicutes bacterium HGW-Firmicutes-9]|jgi:hypothetical protein|nr:MAG: hypothetical protein CVV04_00245 [Firmicutes bacterium HGW-Firmicutes-9]
MLITDDSDRKSISSILVEQSSYTRAPLMSAFADMPTLTRKPARVTKEKPLWDQIQDELKMLKELIDKVPS